MEESSTEVTRRLPTEAVAGEEDLHLGLVPSALPPGIVFVEQVDPGSWAERNGVIVGSEIRAINGKDVATMKADAFRIHLKKRPVKFMLLPQDEDEKKRVELERRLAEEERARAEANMRKLEEERLLVTKVREDMEEERRQMEAERRRMEDERQRIEDERRRAEEQLRQLQDQLAREDEERKKQQAEEQRRLDEEEERRRLKESEKQREEEKLAAWLKEQEEAMRRKREEDERQRKAEEEAQRRAAELEEKRRQEELRLLEEQRRTRERAEPSVPAPWDYGSYHGGNAVRVATGQRASVRLLEEAPQDRQKVDFQVTVDASGAVLGIIPSSWPPEEVRVGAVIPHSSAAEQGVQVGDVLLTLDGDLAQKMSRSVLDSLLRKRPLVLAFRRSVKQESASLENWASTKQYNPAETTAGPFEVTFNFDDRVLGFIPGTWPPGPVQLSAVVPQSAADRRGVRAGDALASINGRDVMGMQRRELLAELRERPLKLRFLRGPGLTTVARNLAVDAIDGARDEADLPNHSYTTDGALMTSWDPPHIRAKQKEVLASMKENMKLPKENLSLAKRAIRAAGQIAENGKAEAQRPHQPSDKSDVGSAEQQESLDERAVEKKASLEQRPIRDVVSSQPDTQVPVPSADLQRSAPESDDASNFHAPEREVEPSIAKKLSAEDLPKRHIEEPTDSPLVNEPDVEPLPRDGNSPAPARERRTSSKNMVPRLNLEGVGGTKKIRRVRNAGFLTMLGQFAAGGSLENSPEPAPEVAETHGLVQDAGERQQMATRADRAIALLQEKSGEQERPNQQQVQGLPTNDAEPDKFQNVAPLPHEKDQIVPNADEEAISKHVDKSGTASTRLRKVRQLDILSMLRSEAGAGNTPATSSTSPPRAPAERADQQPQKQDRSKAQESGTAQQDKSVDMPGDPNTRTHGNLRQNVRRVNRLNVAALAKAGVTDDRKPVVLQGSSIDPTKIPGIDGSGPRRTILVEVLSLYGEKEDSLGILLRSDALIVNGFQVRQAKDIWCLGDKIEAVNSIPVRTKKELLLEYGSAKADLPQHPIIFTVSRLTWGMDPVPKWTCDTDDVRSADALLTGLTVPDPEMRNAVRQNQFQPAPERYIGERRVNGLKVARGWMTGQREVHSEKQAIEFEMACTCGNVFTEDARVCRRCGKERQRKPVLHAKPQRKPRRSGAALRALAQAARTSGSPRKLGFADAKSRANRSELEPPQAAKLESQKQRLAQVRGAVADFVAELRKEEEEAWQGFHRDDEAELVDLEAASLLAELGAAPALQYGREAMLSSDQLQEREARAAAAALLAELSPDAELLHLDWQQEQAWRFRS